MSPIKTSRQECLVYSRVVGWLTPTKNWNLGKQSEYVDRKTYQSNN
ncbi:MAG: anaerobic ribonucleoside-triphosphate reductase [Patescibacteria group bacterium]